MKQLMVVVMLLVVFFGAGLMPAEATLKTPLRGVDLKTQLTNDQHARAMYFMATKANILSAKTDESFDSLKNIERARLIVHAMLDVFNAIDSSTEVYEKSKKIAQATNIIKNGVSGPKLKFYVLQKAANERVDQIFIVAGMLLNGINIPGLTDDELFQEYKQAVASGDNNQVASKFSQLLDHPGLGGQLVVSASIKIATDLVPYLPAIYRTGEVVLELKWWLGFVDSIKLANKAYKVAVPIASIITGSLGICTDVIAMQLTGDITAQLKTTMFALEFLDYYLLTYKGNLAEFKNDIGAQNAQNIGEVVDAFWRQKNQLGQTMKELYGDQDWLDLFSGSVMYRTSAIALISRVLRELGPLAFNISYQGGPGLWYIGVGDTTTYSFTPDPMLLLDYNFTAAMVYQKLPNGNRLEGQPIVGTSTITPLTTLPGVHSFEISYGFAKKGTSESYAYTYSFSDEYIIPNAAVNLPQLVIVPQIVNNLGGYYLSLTFTRPTASIPYSRTATASNTAVSGSITVDATTQFYVRTIDKSGSGYDSFSNRWELYGPNRTIVLPIQNTAALLAKSGVLGTYRIEMDMTNPQIVGYAEKQYDLQINYSDLVTPPTVPYLQIIVPNLATAAYNTADSSFYAKPGDVIRLKVNNDPASFLVNQSGKTVQVVVLVPNGSEFGNFVAGTLQGDQVSFIVGTTLDGLTMPAGRYKVLGIVGIDTNGAKSWANFSVTQLVEKDMTTIIDPPPPVPTGSVILPRTGQYRCYGYGYDMVNREIVCRDSGLDGDIQAGALWPEQRFSDNGDGTVRDNLTGLAWTKNANCFGAKTWPEAIALAGTLSNGICGLNDGSTAGQWRLPNIIELESLIDLQQHGLALPATNLFENIQYQDSDAYWSSTTLPYETTGARTVYLSLGVSNVRSKYSEVYTWFVKDSGKGAISLPQSGQSTSYVAGDDGSLRKGVSWTPEERFATFDSIIKDNLTNLIWVKDANLLPYMSPEISVDGLVSMQSALDFITRINAAKYAGFSDWRLPNFLELKSLVDYSRFATSLPSNHPFTNVQAVDGYSPKYYLTGSQYTGNTDTSRDIGVNLYYGYVSYRQDSGYVWPVRGGFVDPTTKVYPPSVSLISENLPDNTYQVGSNTKIWRFKSGVKPITGLKAVQVSPPDWGLGINQTEIVLGDVAANTEFLVNLAINPVHLSNAIKSSYWKLQDATGQLVYITNSSTGQFWLKLKTNRPPSFSQLQLQSVAGKTGQPLCLPLLATDPDNDVFGLAYTVISGAGVINMSGNCMGKSGPTYYNNSPTVGMTPVKIRVTDRQEESADLDIYTVVINEEGTVKDFFNDLKYANATTDQLKDQYRAINYLALKGIVIGVADPNDPNGRVFEPAKVANQAEALKLLMMAANIRGLVDLDAEPRYLPNLEKLDTATGNYYNFSWAMPYVVKAEALGMIDSAEGFEPYKPVSREWLAGALATLMRLNPPVDLITNPAEYSFADAAAFSTTDAYDKARAAAFFGFMWHLGSTSIFNPQETMIRADVAVVTSKILRQPSFSGITTTGLADAALFGATLPSLPHGQTFNVTGLTNLDGHRMIDDGTGNIKEDDIFNSAEYVKVTVVRPGVAPAVVGEKFAAAMATAPLTVPTNPPDITATETRALLVLIEATDSDGNNPVRNMYRMNYYVIFPDADGDGVRDNLDVWATNPLFSVDANNNGIPDNADALWGLSSRQGSEIITINGQQMTLIDAILNGLYDYPFVVFSLPATSSSLTVGVTGFDIGGGTAPYSYCLATTNSSASCSWNSTKPTSYSFSTAGAKTLYAFAKDATGKVSAARSATTTISLLQSLNVTITSGLGGGGSVTSNPVGIACNSGACSSSFARDSSVSLIATPNAASSFGGWSGACSGTGGCTVTMDADKSLAALFNLIPNARIGATPYGTLNSAYQAVTAGGVIEIKALTFVESLLLNRGLNITLRGGFADNYSGQTGYTALDGVLTVSSGVVTLDRVVVK